MLSDQLRQLLSAYVDGELSNRQRKALERLLRRSPEARALLEKLRDDARRVQALPRQRLGDEFTSRVLRAVRHCQAQARQRELARQGAWPLYAAFAAAATVLLAVGLTSFFYFAQPAHQSAAGDQVRPTTTPPPNRNPFRLPIMRAARRKTATRTPTPIRHHRTGERSRRGRKCWARPSSPKTTSRRTRT